MYVVESKCDSTINMKRKEKKTALNAIRMMTNPGLCNVSHNIGFSKARQSLAALDQSSMPRTNGNR